MTHSQWLRIAADVAARWPNQPWPDATIAAYFEDLRDMDAEQVSVAVRALSRAGREFPPTSGMIRQQVVELTLDLPDWAFVWSCAQSLASYGWGGPYHSYPSVQQRFAEVLERMHPTCRAFLEAAGARQVFDALQEGGSGEARLREKFKDWAARSRREGALVGLQAAGLQVLERVNDGPKRPDFARALPGPKEAA